MTESDIKNIATEHHRKHHGSSAPEVHSGDTNSRISDSAHTSDEHSHHEEEREPKERKETMKNRIAPGLTALVVSAIIGLGLIASNSVQAATIKASQSTINITRDINNYRATSINAGFVTAKSGEIIADNIELNILKEGINEDIINTNNIKCSISADSIGYIVDVDSINLIGVADRINRVVITNTISAGIDA